MKIRFKQDKVTILKLLKTSSIRKKVKILDKLNGVNQKDSIKILLKVLEDNSWVMREKAAYKLVTFGNRVVPRLEKLLIRGFWYTRASACLALGEIGSPKALNSIINLLLNDENPTVIKEASSALVKMARKRPDEFSEKMREISPDEPNLSKILSLLETSAAEVHASIKESIYNE